MRVQSNVFLEFSFRKKDFPDLISSMSLLDIFGFTKEYKISSLVKTSSLLQVRSSSLKASLLPLALKDRRVCEHPYDLFGSAGARALTFFHCLK